MNFLAAPGTALVLSKTKQLSNTLVDAPPLSQTVTSPAVQWDSVDPLYHSATRQKPRGCRRKLTCLTVSGQLSPYDTGL